MKENNSFENIKFNGRLVKQILDRCKNATPKIANRTQEFYIPKIENTPPSLMQYMDYLRNDFMALVRDPKNLVGDGMYDDWTQQEVAELYTVLFDSEIPQYWIDKPKN